MFNFINIDFSVSIPVIDELNVLSSANDNALPFFSDFLNVFSEFEIVGEVYS